VEISFVIDKIEELSACHADGTVWEAVLNKEPEGVRDIGLLERNAGR
jgi:hypothetical protein